MRLYRTVIREIPGKLKPIMVMNVIAAGSAVVFIDLLTSAAQEVAEKGNVLRLAVPFILCIVLIQITHSYTLVNASREAEQLIHKLRIRLFDLVRRSDMVTIEKIGFAQLQGVLAQDTQVLAHILPLLVIGLQQALMLVFMAFFLASQSMLAFFLSFGLSGLAVAVRFARARAIKAFLHSADEAKNNVFNGLTDLLKGFKEVRMSESRAEGLMGAMTEASEEARENNTELMSKWGKDFAVIEVMLYALIGLVVFVVPFFAADFYEVVLPVTIAVLFISGPVSTVSFITPMVSQAELALENIETMQERLSKITEDLSEETDETLEASTQSIEMKNVTHAYRNAAGDPVFSTGPVNASFLAGQITFITGGNGSGKSTLLRLLTGLMPVDSGQILFNGKVLEKDQMQNYRDRISAIFTNFHLSKRIYNVKKQDSDKTAAKIDELLRRLEISKKVKVENNTFSTIELSTGQRKRLAYLVAELEDKPVIVLDEWAADQDPHFRRFFYENILPDLKSRGKIVICVTHDERWFHMADQIYHMNEGKLLQSRDTNE